MKQKGGDINLMKRRTTTAQINEALSNNLLQVTKAECYHKDSHRTDVIDADTFLDNFEFFCESGCFVNCIGWHYQKDYKTNQYIIECCRLDGDSENIVTVYLRVGEGANTEDVEKVLLMKEEE